MTAAMSSEARRFTWLVDVFYDRKVKLLMSAEVAPEQLYTEGMLSNEFHRTVSRIMEMQSREYMDTQRRDVADMIA
jgi:cell division protein ZapE